MAIDLLLQEAQGLSEESLMEVVRFMQFIKAERKNNASFAAQAEQSRRQAGLYQGMIRMTEDFDAPLPEFKEYM